MVRSWSVVSPHSAGALACVKNLALTPFSGELMAIWLGLGALRAPSATFQRTGLAGSWLVAGVELAARRREPLGGPLGGVAERRRDAGTFRESLRLTDSRARAADRQENRPTFTGWSGYPTHLFVCDRDGMTVRAADHRDNTSVRMTSRLSSVVKRPPPLCVPGCRSRRPRPAHGDLSPKE